MSMFRVVSMAVPLMLPQLGEVKLLSSFYLTVE
ncbi:hypothetical protein AJ80_05750 [Polytolypa hystricis UAMH7299]|uniref:Uncharacterized protein n=1 Tax=Polytolypa hystricis (strain UAMH7299) TaxID=1447883 RepID=A0A2B7Y2K0_POLH7|nr:hypothetical protein AJ80_05750 [Polytolypa hystricis UAMH7299]